ncbi:hypothetical protein B9Z19DRAFT_1091361 [Tuber borchii]|uniref:Uncharacterized protein n=1 Tax=Tuber borchii TaxID=42251 RepID=A0A2T6ZHU1_TUBBO|nr:hypothetical protein B9Z19DRAFT_1091361 [Tuber borchii]
MVGCGGGVPLFIYLLCLAYNIVMMLIITQNLMIRLLFPFINFTRQPQSGPPPALPPSTLDQPDSYFLTVLVPTE